MPRQDVVGLTPYQSVPAPKRPVTRAKSAAARWDTRPRTRGRLRVRLILASYEGSNSIFKVLAEAMVRKVPPVR